MSEHWNGDGEHYGEELLAALAPEGELGGRRPTPRRGPRGRMPRPQGTPRRLSPQNRPARGGAARAPGRALGARGRPHGSRCGCARCRRAGGHIAGCDCARCRRGRTLVGRLYAGPAPLGAPGEQGSEHTRWVQSALNRALGLRLPVDGVMSPAVRSAVRSFQRREGLPEDGIVGPPTEAALARAEPASGGEPAGDGGEPAGDAGDGGEEQFIGGLWDTISAGASGAVGALTGAGRIIDRTAHSPKSYRVGKPRDMKKVYALVLHQMAFSRGNDPTRYDKVKSHFAILPDGKILQLHPEAALLMASNGFNTGSVAVEFAGNFPNTRGTCWAADRFGCHKVTKEQIEAGRHLIRHLIRTMGLTHVLAHRQSSASRENDPGPDLWYHVGQWAVDTLGLKDGGPGFKVGTGNPIPDLWRTWGKTKPSPELEAELAPTALDPASPEHTRWLQRALNGALGLRLPEDGRMSPAVRSAVRSFQRRRGLPADGELGDELEGELVALGAPDHSHGEGGTFLGDLWGRLSGYAPARPPAKPSPRPAPAPSTAAGLARQIVAGGRVSFATAHSSGCGKGDGADAASNINAAAAGRAARRSAYDCSSAHPAAPGGTVALHEAMLSGMLELSRRYTFQITEIAGGQHSGTSRHYAGVAFDVNVINGRHVSASHPDYRAFMERARALGATEVLGPGNTGHSTHIHCAWPRPSGG